MEARQLAAALLNCGVLDADFLLQLIDQHDLCIRDLLDEAEGFQWSSHKTVTVNDLIYLVLERVAQEFLENIVKDRICHFSSAEYSIFTNCLDSHLWFSDSNLNRGFEAWRWA